MKANLFWSESLLASHQTFSNWKTIFSDKDKTTTTITKEQRRKTQIFGKRT